MPHRRRSQARVIEVDRDWRARKISETLLAYMSPVVDALPEVPSAQEMQPLVQIAVTVWNAVVVDDLRATLTGNRES